jgi:hypothetical protein
VDQGPPVALIAPRRGAAPGLLIYGPDKGNEQVFPAQVRPLPLLTVMGSYGRQSMATEGSVYRRKSDGRWVAQHKDARGKTRYIYRKSKGEAKEALREAQRDRDDGIVPPSKMTLGYICRNGLRAGERL